MQPGPAQIRGLGLLFPHAPAPCTLLTDLKVARIISCTLRNEENRFERFSQFLHFVWQSDGKLLFFFLFFFDVRRFESGRRPARQPSTVVLEVRLLSIFVDSKDLLPDVAMMCLSGTPCFESRCTSLSSNGLYRCR